LSSRAETAGFFHASSKEAAVGCFQASSRETAGLTSGSSLADAPVVAGVGFQEVSTESGEREGGALRSVEVVMGRGSNFLGTVRPLSPEEKFKRKNHLQKHTCTRNQRKIHGIWKLKKITSQISQECVSKNTLYCQFSVRIY
jgi:hypothetical protein